jgi:hypothetical protein
MLAGGGEALAVVDSTDLGGASAYSRPGALSGIGGGKTFVFSAWVRLDGGDGVVAGLLYAPQTVLGTAYVGFYVIRGASNKFEFVLQEISGPGLVAQVRSVNTYTASGNWIHVLASADTSVPTRHHLYINDVSDEDVVRFDANTDINNNMDDWFVGATDNAPSILNALDGCLAEMYFAPGRYLDFSIESNRRKFISATGKPRFLGSNGAAPTGTAPALYLSVVKGAAVSTFATNKGTGGSFAVTGTPVIGSTSPSD